jgi:hypothetical protein
MGTQSLIGESGAHRAMPDGDFVYAVEEENRFVAKAREASIKRETDRLEAKQKAREALPPAVLAPDFKAVNGQLDAFRRDERI